MKYDLKTIRDYVDAFRMHVEDRTGKPSQIFSYPARFIYQLLRINRSYVMDMDVSSDVDENQIITIPCVNLEEAPIVDCPCAPADGCYWFRSTHALPKFVNGQPLAVTTVDGNVQFNYVRWFNFPKKMRSRMKAHRVQPYYTFKNQDDLFHLYVYANAEICGEKLDQLQAVKVAGEFEDPLDVACYPVCGEFNTRCCDPLDQDWIIEPEYIIPVFDLTFENISKSKRLQPNSDILNNDQEDSEVSPPNRQ